MDSEIGKVFGSINVWGVFMYLLLVVSGDEVVLSKIGIIFTVQGTKTRLHDTRDPEHKFNNRELHTQHIFLTTQQDRYWSLIFG